MLTNLRVFMDRNPGTQWGVEPVLVTLHVRGGDSHYVVITEEHMYYVLAHLDGVDNLTHQVVDGSYEQEELPVRSIRFSAFGKKDISWQVLLLSEIVGVSAEDLYLSDNLLIDTEYCFSESLDKVEPPQVPALTVLWHPDFKPDPESREESSGNVPGATMP